MAMYAECAERWVARISLLSCIHLHSECVCDCAFYVNDTKLNAQNSKLNKFMHTKYT